LADGKVIESVLKTKLVPKRSADEVILTSSVRLDSRVARPVLWASNALNGT
jgi:hypothetical protein